MGTWKSIQGSRYASPTAGYRPISLAYSGRFDHPYHLRDDCRINIDKPPSEYIKKLYFDTVVFSEHQLRYI
jgi:hypothetical protein